MRSRRSLVCTRLSSGAGGVSRSKPLALPGLAIEAARPAGSRDRSRSPCRVSRSKPLALPGLAIEALDVEREDRAISAVGHVLAVLFTGLVASVNLSRSREEYGGKGSSSARPTAVASQSERPRAAPLVGGTCMRLKIILPNAIIVLVVGLLSYFFVRQRLQTLEDPAAVRASAERSAVGATAVLQLQLLRAERWLAEHGSTDVLRDRLGNLALEDRARREKASAALGDLKRFASDAKTVFADPPDLAALVDKDGKAVGRSEDPQTYAGDDFGAEYPSLVAAIKENRTGSDLWLASRFAHKHMVSYAPVRDASGAPIGAVILAWSLTDPRVERLSDGAAALVVIEGGVPKVKAKAGESAELSTELEGAQKDAVSRALRNGADVFTTDTRAVALSALRNLGGGDRVALAVAKRISTIERPDQLVWPILATCGLGLAFVIIAGAILGGYVTDPVAQMEESLLKVINGDTNHRVQIEHTELGGLAFRINQLLNTVLGVEEDNTDEEGRPSAPPEKQHFNDALAVDDNRGAPDAAQAAALAAEPEGAYYARLYREYIEAKQANGEGVEGITEDVFVNRIRGMERDQAAKMGRPVRYAVQRREGQVRLLAIPI
jgi:hypothetical protein